MDRFRLLEHGLTHKGHVDIRQKRLMKCVLFSYLFENDVTQKLHKTNNFQHYYNEIYFLENLNPLQN